MTYNIRPIGNRVLIKMVKKQKTSASGIILSTKEENEQVIGEILAIGNGVGEKNNIKDLGLKAGDKVLVGNYSGQEIKENENDEAVYKIVEGKDILGVVEM